METVSKRKWRRNVLAPHGEAFAVAAEKAYWLLGSRERRGAQWHAQQLYELMSRGLGRPLQDWERADVREAALERGARAKKDSPNIYRWPARRRYRRTAAQLELFGGAA